MKITTEIFWKCTKINDNMSIGTTTRPPGPIYIYIYICVCVRAALPPSPRPPGNGECVRGVGPEAGLPRSPGRLGGGWVSELALPLSPLVGVGGWVLVLSPERWGSQSGRVVSGPEGGFPHQTEIAGDVHSQEEHRFCFTGR